MFRATVAFTLVCLAASFVLLHKSSGTERDAVVPAVVASDLPNKAVIVGRLGKPMGTLVNIRGMWTTRERRDEPTLVFLVTHVEGRLLQEPVRFSWIDSFSPTGAIPPPARDRERAEGIEWEMRAWESGRYRGVPKGAYAEFENEVDGFGTRIPYPAGDFSFRFDSDLVYCRRQVVKSMPTGN